MKYIRDEENMKLVKDIFEPVKQNLYNDFYVYIWFICIYNVFLLCLFVANFFIMFRIMSRMNKEPPILFNLSSNV